VGIPDLATIRVAGLFVFSLSCTFLDLVLMIVEMRRCRKPLAAKHVCIELANEISSVVHCFQSELFKFDIAQIF